MLSAEKPTPIAVVPTADVSLRDVAREFLRHRDNALFVAPCAALILLGAVTGIRPADVLWFAIGWLIFLPQEWLTHFYILHWPGAAWSETYYRWMYRLHYGHHDFPRRDDLMYMPPWLTLPMTAFNLALYFAIAPDTRAALAAFAGGLAGYLAFEWSHLLCHVPYTPKTAWVKKICERHAAHHFVTEHRWFSVSPPAVFIDRLMRTGGARADATSSGSSRFLLADLDQHWLERARAAFAHRTTGDATQSGLWTRYAQNRARRAQSA